MTGPRVLVALSAAMLTIIAVPARGQSAAERPPRKKAATVQRADPKRQPPGKIMRLEEMKVEGRIQKPQAMFLMPRANLNYGELERFDRLLPKVTKAIEKDPF